MADKIFLMIPISFYFVFSLGTGSLWFSINAQLFPVNKNHLCVNLQESEKQAIDLSSPQSVKNPPRHSAHETENGGSAAFFIKSASFARAFYTNRKTATKSKFRGHFSAIAFSGSPSRKGVSRSKAWF
ncbi:MAG: hypothetical protein Q4C72_01820 [Eubacteriales bacterium]|nr:hypothetical protein [Eubacteriales bacterium]